MGDDTVQRLTDDIITWFENRTGFHVSDHHGDEATLLSACYGGNWISFDAEKLAEHLAKGLESRPLESVNADLLEAAKQALVALQGVDRTLHAYGMMKGVQCPAIPVLEAAISRAEKSNG